MAEEITDELDSMSEPMKQPRIMSMEVDLNDDDSSFYRVLLEDHVRYIEIKPHTLEGDVRSFPLNTILPVLHRHDESPETVPAAWTTAIISRNHDNCQLQASFSNEVLPGVRQQWCTTKVSCLDLERTKQLKGSVFEAKVTTKLPNLPAKCSVIFKIADFDWEIHRIERETRAYRLLEQLRQNHGINLAPRFLGHVHEHGRIMGFIIEKIEGVRYAFIEDLKLCETILRDLHQSLDLLHGDVNRYNFLITEKEPVKVLLIDFERSEEHASAEATQKELDSLTDRLLEETRRGAGYCRDSDEE